MAHATSSALAGAGPGVGAAAGSAASGGGGGGGGGADLRAELEALKSRVAIDEERHAIELASVRKERDEVLEELNHLQAKFDKQKKKYTSEIAALREEVHGAAARCKRHPAPALLNDGRAPIPPGRLAVPGRR